MFFLFRRAARQRENAEIAAAQPNNITKKRMTDLLVERISDWSTMVGIGIGILAWWFAREDANRKADALERYKEDSSKETAALKKEAAEARLKTAQIQSHVAWRTLSTEQKDALGKKLSERPLKILLKIVGNDPEALWYAMELRNVLPDEGVETEMVHFQDTLAFGVFVTGDSPDDVALVRSAFTEAGVRFSTQAVKGTAMTTTRFGLPKSFGVKILVASKLRPETKK